MRNNPYLLRCYARPEDDYILGVCVDLNIAVRGDTIEEVKNEMRDAIESYFKSLDKTNFQDVFPRPVPMRVRMDYYAVCCIVNCLKFKTSFKKNFQIFCEQLIPQKFTVFPGV